jgi:membrane associated rhomboid family serine protease
MTPWVLRLIFANAAVFLLTSTVPGAEQVLGLWPAGVLLRPWTPITYMFVHAGFLHILFNMVGLFFFGPRLEARLGGRRFLGLYFTSGLAGAAASVMTPNALIVGASGAIFGVLYGFAHYWPHEKAYIWGVLPVEMWLLVVGFTALSVFGAVSGGGGVAHFAHLGGFVGGFLFIRISERFTAAARFKARAAPVQPKKKGPDVQDLNRWRAIRGDEMHPVNREELNRILDKISSKGLASLTADERAFLDRFSKLH